MTRRRATNGNCNAFSSALGNPCTATAVLPKRIGGVYSVLSSVPVPCENMMQVRLVAISYDATNGALLGYIDNHGYLHTAIHNAPPDKEFPWP